MVKLRVRRKALGEVVAERAGLFVITHPAIFLTLTTGYKRTYRRILVTVTEGTDDFDPKDHDFPFMRINPENGRVVGHDGRHRAAMILKEGGFWYPFAIFFQKQIDYEQYSKPATKNEETGKPWRREDIPDTLFSQFIPEIHVSSKQFVTVLPRDAEHRDFKSAINWV